MFVQVHAHTRIEALVYIIYLLIDQRISPKSRWRRLVVVEAAVGMPRLADSLIDGGIRRRTAVSL